MYHAHIISFVAGFLFAAGALGQPGYVSPLQGSLSTHDPVIMKQDSVYYVFHTGNGIPIKTSRDRLTWSNGTPASVYDSIPAWHLKIRNSRDSWAPSIAKWGGKYWLYYSLSNFGERRSAIGLRTNTTLNPADTAYKWVDQGMVVCSYNNATTHPECYFANTTGVNTTDTNAHNAIDPDVFVDSAGTPWLTWGSFGAGIKQIKLNPTTGKPDSGEKLRTLAHRYTTQSASGSGYERSIEGPVVRKRGAWYYLWYSYDRCCAQANSTYKIMVTRSSSIMGPYVDKAGNLAHPPFNTGTWQTANAGTVVAQGDSINWAAMGHNDIFVDNDTTFLVNHGYVWPGGQTRLMIRPLYWTADGWPTLDSTQGSVVTSIRSTSNARLPARVERRLNGLWVPGNKGFRDLNGKQVGGR